MWGNLAFGLSVEARRLHEQRPSFQCHEHFKKADLDARQDLYRKLEARSVYEYWGPSEVDLRLAATITDSNIRLKVVCFL